MCPFQLCYDHSITVALSGRAAEPEGQAAELEAARVLVGTVVETFFVRGHRRAGRRRIRRLRVGARTCWTGPHVYGFTRIESNELAGSFIVGADCVQQRESKRGRGDVAYVESGREREGEINRERGREGE